MLVEEPYQVEILKYNVWLVCYNWLEEAATNLGILRFNT